MRPGPKFALMRATFLHLRFPFVYILSPIFVWGAAWGPGGWTARTALAFLLVHLALYPGANAFNSAYDRDTGPIGGLARPPVVPAGLGRWSVWLQGVGAALSLVVGPLFATGYAALWGIFTAYSHPRTRWKRSPIASTAAIVAGQGGIGYWLGWSAAGTAEPAPRSIGSVWTAADAWALAAACAVVAALYPLTQVYPPPRSPLWWLGALGGPSRIAPLWLSPLADLELENSEEENRPCIEHGFLIVGSGLNGDPVAVELGTGGMAFLSHDLLWEREYEDFEECVVRTPLGLDDFWVQAEGNADFPADSYDARSFWSGA